MENRKNMGDSGQATREYFDSLQLEMRLIDSDLPDTSLQLYGETFTSPVMTAALSHLGNVHPDGMVELARGAAQAGVVMWAGMGSEDELAAIVETGAKTIKIIKPYEDNELILRKIEHARRCGVLGVGIDIDHAFGRKGGYDTVGGFSMRPKTAEELKGFAREAGLPFVIKGVLSVQDAQKCLAAGISGIVVSHHHGIMDYAVPPLKILPRISKVAGRMPVFVDCNVERGMDALKAMALGATAVSVGRALMGPLKEGGATAVAEKLQEIRTELVFAMAMTGSANNNSIDPTIVWQG